MFFTNRGQVFSLKVFNLPEGTRTSKGRNLVNLIQLDPGDKVKEILCVPKEMKREDKFLIFGTERGLVKKLH